MWAIKHEEIANVHKSTENQTSLMLLYSELLYFAFLPLFQENLQVRQNQGYPDKNSAS